MATGVQLLAWILFNMTKVCVQAGVGTDGEALREATEASVRLLLKACTLAK